VVLLDPPAFIKRKKDLSAGLRHYQLNNRLAVELLKPGGLLFTASCSQPLTSDALAGAVRDAAGRNRRRAQVLAALRQAPDHPVHAAMPETDYLNGFIVRLLR
jgi:23S rRNA (cytosine1962-C5)-methyltransferase